MSLGENSLVAAYQGKGQLKSRPSGTRVVTDPMLTWLLKSFIDLPAPYITSLFNSSLSSGAFPTCYKDAYVTLCLKKLTLPPCELSSYRSISNLSFLSKLLERVVSVQLTGYLSSAGLLPVHQSAYRRFHLTETALLKVVTDIR